MNRYLTAFKRLYGELDILKKQYKRPKWWFMLDECISFLIHGSTPNEYMHFNLYKLKGYERRQFLTYARTNRLEKKYNAKENYHIFWDKQIFNKTFSEFVSRDWIYAPEAAEDDIRAFISRHSKIVVKPTSLSSGRGIYIKNTAEITDLDIKSYIEEKKLLEEVVVQCGEMASLNPSSVNTVRVYTVLDKNDKVNIISAAIRVGGKGSVVDNYHSGGCGFPVDEKTGIVSKAGVDFEGKEHLCSPSTGVLAVGFQIPRWNELVHFIESVASKLKNSRLIAWDVAVKDDGFELIEGNYKWSTDFMQALDKKGRYKIIKKML